MDFELPGLTDTVLAVSVFLVAGVVAFTAVQDRYSYGQSLEVDSQVNSSQEVSEVRFFNHSIDLMLEGSENASFYLDLDRDGSADERLRGLRRDGRIHSTAELVDFGDGVYRLYIRYQDEPGKSGDAWMRVFRVESLG